ncbi:MAG: ATP-binding protein [Bryobacteraceae bacterium]
MNDLKGQLVSALLVVLTAAGLICAGINFQHQRRTRLADDGAIWVDRTSESGTRQVVALHLVEGGAAQFAGIKPGDVLVKIESFPIAAETDVTRVLARVGAYRDAQYTVRRTGMGGAEVEIKAKVVLREQSGGSARFYQYGVGLFYLAIGLFVYFRRARAAHATHFYVLCLASFVLSTFHYTGVLSGFDKVIYWGNVVAGLFAPTIFLHFCLTFPEERAAVRGKKQALLYVPALLITMAWLGVTSGVVRVSMSMVELRWLMDRGWLLFLSAVYLTGAVAATLASRRASDPIVRQQLKWLRNGAVLGVVPFTCLYAIPYIFGAVPGPYMNLAVLSLIFVPLTWAYAILRYRLMDVDVIFQQGFAYTLATLGVMGLFYTLVLTRGPVDELDPSVIALLIVGATFVFQPLRNSIQELLDRHVFYKDRYDYRQTLEEFARELSSETDMDAMLVSVADRLRRTLYIKNVGFFLLPEGAETFELIKYVSEENRLTPADRLDLSFLRPQAAEPLFFEQTGRTLDVVMRDWEPSARLTIARLDLTYYLPCRVRGRTIAFMGVSRSSTGDFLSGEDLELLTTLSGSVGIAIENARLYRSLQRKVEENERLKEFNENIVESLNVGIVAAGLDDCVESWNGQMEELTGIPRARAAGHPVRSLLPAALVNQLDALDGETVEHLYKVQFPPARAEEAFSVVANGGVIHSNGDGGSSQANGNGGNGHANGKTSNGNAKGAKERGARVVNVAVAPLVARDQKKIGRLILFDDVTERSELEQRLMQTDKLSSIGLLAAGVAHEVNTPLAVISSYAQMLAKQIAADDPKNRLLEKIAKQTFRASEIVNSLLNFSRTSKTEFEEVDLNRVIRETLSLIEHQLDKSGVEVREELDETLPAVRGNFGKMQQVFLNLFLNARDAMEAEGAPHEGGRILTVSTRTAGAQARIEVADTGKGIDAGDLARIYDPFFTTKGARKGTGLGLAVTYGIVREHGGTIEAESRPGEGTRFSLEFPPIRKPVHA